MAIGTSESAWTMPQRELAARLGLSYSEALPSDIVGVAENVRPNAVPLNGLRHPLNAVRVVGTSGQVRRCRPPRTSSCPYTLSIWWTGVQRSFPISVCRLARGS